MDIEFKFTEAHPGIHKPLDNETAPMTPAEPSWGMGKG